MHRIVEFSARCPTYPTSRASFTPAATEIAHLLSTHGNHARTHHGGTRHELNIRSDRKECLLDWRYVATRRFAPAGIEPKNPRAPKGR